MDFGPGRKRGRSDAAFNGNGGPRRSKQEMESFPTGIGSKSKPCTKFFSTSGCPFGEGCHFLHYVPGGINAVAQMTNLGGSPALLPSSRNPVGPPHIPDGSSPPAVKTRLCNNLEGDVGRSGSNRANTMPLGGDVGRSGSNQGRNWQGCVGEDKATSLHDKV